MGRPNLPKPRSAGLPGLLPLKLDVYTQSVLDTLGEALRGELSVEDRVQLEEDYAAARSILEQSIKAHLDEARGAEVE